MTDRRRVWLVMSAVCPLGVATSCVLVAMTASALAWVCMPEGLLHRVAWFAMLAVALASSVFVLSALGIPGPPGAPRLFPRRGLDRLAVGALILLGATYGIVDSALELAVTSMAPPVVLAGGLIAGWPLLLNDGRGIRVRRLLAVVALAAAFLGWVAAVPRIDWNPRKPFLRAFAQIQPGMTRPEVEAVMAREFPGRRPTANWSVGAGFLTLDPDDGRYNAEIVGIQMSNGRVVSTQYLPD